MPQDRIGGVALLATVLFCVANREAAGGPVLIRGPYLQSGSSTNVILRWRTDPPTDSVVRWGTDLNDLTEALTNTASTSGHEMALTGLVPASTYYYAAGNSTHTFAAGPEFRFTTSPTNARPCRIWVIGDAGTADLYQESVRDAYYAVTWTNDTDLWLMLGDNAYYSGLDDEYQAAVFDMYSDLLRRTVLWPTIGNHDAGDDPGQFGTYAATYLDIFSLPRNGEARSRGHRLSGSLWGSDSHEAVRHLRLQLESAQRLLRGGGLGHSDDLRNDQTRVRTRLRLHVQRGGI